VAAQYEMRVSDTEREAAAAELREHFASGRLNQDELEQRLSAVFAAKTRGDLNAVFTDLPSSGHGWTDAQAAGSSSGPGAQAWGPWTRPGDGNSDWQARGNAWRASAGRGIGRILTASVLVWVLFIVGILGVFGIGTGRPFGIVLILAAFAMLRRVLFMIFGRRGGRGRGGRGRGRGRRR
jgi:Domain of unknown function (DUF1707)